MTNALLSAILVVDDEEYVRRIAARLLKEKGYTCVQAENGTQALQILAEEEIALVISDIMMPVMSGLELLEAIQQSQPDVAVIMLTAVDCQETAIKALELGAYGYIIKPFDPRDLLFNVVNALRRRDLEMLHNEYEHRLEREVNKQTTEIRLREAQLHTLTNELSLTEERERRRIATALHDQISQMLAFAKIELRALMAEITSSAPLNHLERIFSYIDQAYQQTKVLTFELSPPILYDLGMEAAFDWLAEQYQTQHGLNITFIRHGDALPLQEQIALILFRAVQELLTNVVKHANAHQVTIQLDYSDTAVRISVTDDGIGYDASRQLAAETKKQYSFGLRNLSERIDYIGGTFELTSQPNQGTQVVIQIPFTSREEVTGNDSA